MRTIILFLGIFILTQISYAQVPLNNDCANAEVITVTTTTFTDVNFDNGMATQSLLSSCDTSATTYPDVWFEFTMPVNGNIKITNVNFADGFSLYSTCGGAEIACFYDDEFVYNLPMGTYKLRVVSTQVQAGADSFRIQAFETVVNDDCATAQIITDDITTQRTINFDNRGATESLDASCDIATNTYLDVWYQFTMPVNGNLHISGVNSLDQFTLYDGCGGTEIICSNSQTYAYNLTSGVYLLRAYSRSIYATGDSFSIQAFATVTNDDCGTAEVITEDITTERTINFDNRGATESLDASCDTASNTHLDVWYEFTMPVNGNLRLSGVNSLDKFTLYDSCGGTEISCTTGNTFVYDLTIGTYLLRAYKNSIYASSESFKIQAFATATNDDCANAQVISDDITTQRTIAFNNQNATQSVQASCDATTNTYLDIWYEFTMPVQGNLQITGVNSLDRFTLYDSCGGNEVACSSGSFFAYDLSIGTYLLRVYSVDIYSSADSFQIQAFETATNNECVNAQVITDDITTQRSVVYDNRKATQSVQASCDTATNTYLDLWYEFSMPVNGNVQISGVNSLDRFTFYDSCGGNELACFNNGGFVYGLSPGIYLLRVHSQSIYASSDSFSIQAFETPTNDTCASAELAQVAAIGECTSQNITIELRGSSVASTVGSCQNDTVNWLDAWYTFEATLTGNITLNSTSTFNNFAVFDACNGTEVACFSNNGSIPVTFGNTYYLQVSRRDIYANSATFCLEGAPVVATGTAGICENIPSVEISTAQGNTNNWVPILDTSSNIVAAINANGNDLGTVTTTLFIDNADTRDFSGQPYLRREVSISTSIAPVSNVQVRLYMLQDEVNDLMLADSNLNTVHDIEVMKINGNTCTTGYVSGGDFISSNTTAYQNDYYIRFLTDSFSVFYPSSTNLSSTLTVIDTDNPLKIKVQPTITDDTVYLSAGALLTNVQVQLFDSFGRKIKHITFQELKEPTTIHLANYATGLYFMKIIHSKGQLTQRILIK